MAERILERFTNALEHEIKNGKSPFHFMFLAKNHEVGNVTDEDLIEIRGYYKGLKVAREMLQRIIAEEDELAEMEGGIEND